MKTKLLMAFSAAVSVCALVAGAVSLAWFSGSGSVESNIDASAVISYFGGGDGTEEDPYLINDPRHLYNLSWLQNMGVFQEKVYYFKLSSGFTMPQNNAVPPIGTTEYPFMGVFDGNEQTISNIWVSSDPNDWLKKPMNYSNISMGKDIGFFGNIQKSNSESNIYGGVVKSFYLDGLKVTSNINDSVVGLIAGNIDGTLSGVGVKNGSFEFNNTNSNDNSNLKAESTYTLIGNINNNVDWVDKPGFGGNGDLEIVPADYPEEGTTWDITNKAGTIPCINAVNINGDPNAKIVGKMSLETNNSGKQVSLYKYKNTDLQFGNEVYSVKSLSDSEKINSPATNTTIEKRLREIFGSQSKKSFKPVEPPVFPETPKALPTNCVWFNPVSDGFCTVAFYAGNMNNSGRMAIYRITRENYCIVKHEEMVFEFYKGQGGQDKSILTQGDIVYFTFPVKKGYEYAIGKDSNNTNTNVSFIFLKLAGTSIDPGNIGPEKRIVLNVDYMKNIPVSSSELDVWDKDYKVKDVLIETKAEIPYSDGKERESASYYFSNNIPSDNKVHYTYDSDITVTNTGTQGADDTK